MPHTSDVAFSPAVKAVQQRLGSRDHFARRPDWPTEATDELEQFLGAATSVFLATASAAGQPYIQHRGGPKGFLQLIDRRTIGFADFAGNRQYITLGNLGENPQAMLFVMDYETRRRVKLWGRARVIEDDPALVARLFPAGYAARGERAVLFEIAAWDVNCRQHIPQLFPAVEVLPALDAMDQRIRALEAENAELRRQLQAG
ncbi:hypothetical protein EDC65_3067 [Stella humosa]|uniref:Pyridoxamine 5'-phosphate oxidase N-terminal domain-containing protein n=1 Tax=Stella humosa TaxID=94 RepID=A0A3N1LJL6_9PROT|nr:pyridoxamine 5'-phosphate oxidase family protein [Stella humosa]ROP91204.1 hypothetical protein EDC65_3067 [Stella humosa]BBK34444.1 pyridoxamine 5'-phosphate oxidase [Stella humosa]